MSRGSTVFFFALWVLVGVVHHVPADDGYYTAYIPALPTVLFTILACLSCMLYDKFNQVELMFEAHERAKRRLIRAEREVREKEEKLRSDSYRTHLDKLEAVQMKFEEDIDRMREAALEELEEDMAEYREREMARMLEVRGYLEAMAEDLDEREAALEQEEETVLKEAARIDSIRGGYGFQWF